MGIYESLRSEIETFQRILKQAEDSGATAAPGGRAAAISHWKEMIAQRQWLLDRL